MGRVCPAPCESGCNRNEVDDYVGINAVEQYVGDWANENNVKMQAPETETGKQDRRDRRRPRRSVGGLLPARSTAMR